MERREETLQVPQLAMLAARVKNSLTARLMESDMPRDAVFQHRLTDYFPTMLRERYPEAVVAHPLGSEILAATLANELVDVAGPGFTYQLTDETNATLDDVVRAYEVAATIFDIPRLWETIHGLDAGIDLDVVATMSVEVRKLLVKATQWLLTHRVRPFDAKADLNRYRGILPTLIPEVGGWLQGADAAGASAVRSRLAAAGVSPDLAGRIGAATHSVHLFDVCDIVLGTADEGESGPASPAGPAFTGRLYYALASHLGIDFLVRSLHDRERSGAWRSKVTFLVQYQLYQAVRGITRRIVRDYATDDPHAAIDGWARHNSYAIGQAQALSSTASLSDATDPSDYFIAAHAFSSLVL